MGLFKKKPKDTSVYGQLKNQTPSESIRYRDVYENQQIKRSKIGSAGSMTVRKVFVIICAVGAFIAGWGVMSGVQWIGAQMTGAGPASYCAEVQIDMNARYQEALKAAQEAYANGEVVEETPSEDESSVDESVESEQPTVVDVDTDGDGERDSVDMDDDNDGLVDTFDTDDDGDGIPDKDDPDWLGDTGASIGTGSQMGVSESYTIDYDGDGVEDTLFVGEDMVRETADDYYDADVNADGRIERVYVGQYRVKLAEGETAPVDESGNPVELAIYREDDYIYQYAIGDIARDIKPGADLEFGTQDDIVVLSRNDSVPGLGYYVGLGGLSILKVLICLSAFAIAYSLLMAFMKKNWEAQNVMYDTADINQWENDQHIQVPEEIQENYDWFPDVGAHSPVQVSSLISHMALTNKGLKSIKVTRRADKDIRDESGQIVYYKGEALVDDDGVELTHKKPMIDEKFMDELWDASLLPPDKTVRRKFDPNAIPYNPGNKSREKLKDAETVADMINKYWTFPSYEPQRPGGAYIVDTEPVNTMVWLALVIRRNV